MKISDITEAKNLAKRYQNSIDRLKKANNATKITVSYYTEHGDTVRTHFEKSDTKDFDAFKDFVISKEKQRQQDIRNKLISLGVEVEDEQ